MKKLGFLVAPREILKSAAALQDVSRYVQGLPGVTIGTNDFRNDIIVRGGSPLENLFIINNMSRLPTSTPCRTSPPRATP